MGAIEEARPGLAPDAAAVDHAERVGDLGRWVWTPETGELFWSDNCFRLLGLEPGSIVPTAEYLVSRVHPDDRDAFLAVLADLVAGEMRGIEYRVIREDGAVRHLDATIAWQEEPGAHAPRRIAGFARDVTLQRAMEREVAARTAVTAALHGWPPSFEAGARELLSALARTMGFRRAVLWGKTFDGFSARAAWQPPSAGRGSAGAPGEGAAVPARSSVARAFAGEAVVAEQLPAGPAADERASALGGAGITSVVAVAARAGSETIAVLELMAAEPIEPCDRLVTVLSAIGDEVGDFLARRRGELDGGLLSPREIQVLQMAAGGLSVKAISAELHVSPSTVKRHFENAYERLGVSDRAAAVAEAMRRGYIS